MKRPCCVIHLVPPLFPQICVLFSSNTVNFVLSLSVSHVVSQIIYTYYLISFLSYEVGHFSHSSVSSHQSSHTVCLVNHNFKDILPRQKAVYNVLIHLCSFISFNVDLNQLNLFCSLLIGQHSQSVKPYLN